MLYYIVDTGQLWYGLMLITGSPVKGQKHVMKHNYKYTKTVFFILFTTLILIFALILFLFRRPYKIGVIISTESSIGSEQNLAIRYIAGKYTSIGTHPLVFIIKNPHSDQASIRKACSSIKKRGVSAVIGGSLSSEGVIIHEEFAETGIPYWGLTTSTGLLSKMDDNFFRITIPADLMGEYYGHYMNSRAYKKILFVKSENNRDYSNSLSRGFRKSFKGQFKSHFFRELDLKRENFSGEYDAIFTVLPASSLMQLLKSLKMQKSHSVLYTTDWGFDELLSLYSGPLIEGTTTLTRRGTMNPEYESLVNDFARDNRVNPTYSSVISFVIANIVVRGIQNAGPDHDKLLEYFKNKRHFNSGYGECSLDTFGDPEYSFLRVKQIKGGEPVLTGSIIMKDE
jgi:ABC-type branched-subunit amino acid transport system substrate-binding protein